MVEECHRRVEEAELKSKDLEKITVRLRRQVEDTQKKLDVARHKLSMAKDTNRILEEANAMVKLEKGNWRKKYHNLKASMGSVKRKLNKSYEVKKKMKEGLDAKLAIACALVDERERGKQEFVIRKMKGKGIGFTPEFEEHAKILMATGISAPACLAQLELDARFFLGQDNAKKLKLPGVKWLAKLREAVGVESWLYAFIAIAGADNVLQHGFDETGINRSSTCNQWCLIKTGDKVELVVIEAGGLLVGGTAEDMKEHVKYTWHRGQVAVNALRSDLGELADDLVPLRKGGVRFLKVMALMHDTCNTANLAAKKLIELKEESGREAIGDEAWDAKPESVTKMLDYLCANHTRNLHVAAFNRRFKKLLEESLGEDFDKASSQGGGATRLEKDGPSLLRSMCKLAHDGHKAYEKGDGKEIKQWLQEHFPQYSDVKVGRAELAHRQDWVLEVSEKLLPLVMPLLKYLAGTLVLDENILRDSILMRLELLHFDAFVFVCATMWVQVYDELRSLTNSKVVSLNPMELHSLYDSLWELGTTLQGPRCMEVLQETFRPWPKIKAGNAAVDGLYANLEARAGTRLKRLHDHRDRPDCVKYDAVLREVFAIFGESIHESLGRTMSEYLESTNGACRTSNLNDWEKDLTKQLRSDNNPAERPFAVMKDLQHKYPSMSLVNLGRLSQARVNGTFRIGSEGGKTKKTKMRIVEDGVAMRAHPKLRQAVTRLCSVKRYSLGLVTQMVRGHVKHDEAADAARRKEDRSKLIQDKVRVARSKAEQLEAAQETSTCSMAGLLVHLKGLEGQKGNTIKFLKSQFKARVTGRGWKYETINAEYRGISGKLKMTPPSGRDEVEYLTSLLKLMIAEDLRSDHAAEAVSAKSAVRRYDHISPLHTSLWSKEAQEAMVKIHEDLAKPVDDPLLLELIKAYKGKLLLDFDDNVQPNRTYKVLDVQFDDKGGSAYWEATCAEVRQGTDGNWAIPPEHYVHVGEERIVNPKLLWGVILVCLKDPDNPVKKPYADEYIMAHQQREVATKLPLRAQTVRGRKRRRGSN